METETKIPDDASTMSKAPEDKHSLVPQFDSILNQCEIAGSMKPSCGVSQHLQRFEYKADTEEMQKGDKATKIMITSTTTQEDKNSAESSSNDKPSTENVSELGYSQEDILVNQQPKQISENETEDQKGIQSKDIEMGGHKIEIINNTNIEEYDHDIENEEVSSPTWVEEPHLKVHEQESSRDNSNSSHDQHLEAISNQHAPTEKQTITSQTNENTIPKEKEDADLEYNEQATSLCEANLGVINEVLIPNLELETKNLYKDDERVTEAGVKDEDMDNKCNSNSTTHIEDKNRDISLIGVQNKKAEISYVQEGEWKAPESIRFSNNLVYDDDNNRKEDSSKASQDTAVLKYQNLQGLETTDINLSNNTEEQENAPALDKGEKSEINDDPQIIQEEAKEIELATEKQLPETAIESVREQEPPSTVPTSAIVEDGIVEKTIQEQTHEEEESTMIDDDKSCPSEIEHEQSAKVFEAIDLLETMSKVCAENEEHADQKSEAQISENMITKHVDSDEMGATESIEKSSYDVKELEQTPELPSAENSEINDGGKIMSEEAIGVPEGQALLHLPTIESVIVETFDKSIQEEIHKDDESAVTDTEEGQIHANEIEDKTNVLEALELNEVNGSTNKENEKKAEPQSGASLDTIVSKHPYLERQESTEINLSNDTGEQENVPPSDTGEKSEIKDGPQVIQEEAKEIQLATENQSPETATESVLEKDVPSTMPTVTLAVVQSGTVEKTIQKLTHEEEEPAPTDDDKSCTQENEHELATKVLEAIDLPKTMSKVSAENEEHPEQKPEAQRRENVITKHVDSEEMVTTENIEKSSYDVKEVEKTPELPSAEHQEINDGGKITPEESLGVPEDQTPQPVPIIASTRVENADKSIQEEIHKDAESAMTDTEEGPVPENEFEERTNVLEAFDLHELIASTSEENEKKAEQQSEANRNTTILKQPDLEGLETTKINTSNDTEETKNLQALERREKLEIKDGAKILQDEARDMEQGKENQLPEAGIESVPEQEALSTMPKLVIVEGGTVDKRIQEQTHAEEESTPIYDDKSCTPENEHEKATKVLEAIDLPETMSEVSAENEENADQNSKEHSSDRENWITNHIDSKEMVTSESMEKSSHDVKELEKTPELHSAENRDTDDGGKITLEEAVGVPEGHTLQPLPTLASAGVQTVDKSIQDGIHKDGKSAVTDTEEEQTHEDEFEDKTNSLEAFELHEIIANTSEENEKKVEPESTASLDTYVLKHPHLEGLETTEIKLSNDTEEQENCPAPDIGEKLEIKDDPEIIQEEAKEMDLATEIHLPETVTESVPEDQTLQPPSTINSVVVETIDKSIQEEIHKDGKSAVTDTEEEQTHENKFEAYDLHEVIASATEENEKKAEPESETSLESTVLEHSNLEGLETIKINPCNDTEEVENFLASDTVEKSEIKDGSKRIQEEAKEMELAKEMTSVTADQTLPSLPTIAYIGVETVNKSFQEEIQKIGKSVVTDTKEGQKQENEFEDKTIVHEAFKLDEVIARTSMENEKKAEPQSEASLDTIVLKHPSLEVLETTEINLNNETEEQENVLASDIGEKLEIKDGPQIIKEEAKEMELTTENQLPESATELTGLAVQEALSAMPTLAIVEGGMVEKIIEEQTHEDDKSTPKDDDKSCTPENEHEQATKVLEAIVLPETMSKVSAENEEHADQKSESQSRENVIIKHVDSEEVATMESIKKSSYDVKEVEMTPELPSAEYQEINNRGRIMPDEALGVPHDQILQPLPSIASVGVETGDRSIQEEIHTHDESAVIDTEEGQTHENESEDKTEVLEAFDLCDEIECNSKENRKKGELQSDASLGNTVLTDPNLEGLETTELHPSIHIEESENVSAPDTVEELDIKDFAHIIQEEAKGMELATERQLLDAATESVHEQEAPSTMPTPVIVEVGMIEKIIQEQTHEEEESTPKDDDKSCARENEHEQATEVLEAIDLPKTTSKASVENEEHTDQKSEAQSCKNMITKHIYLEEMMTKERTKISSYDVSDLEIQELPSSENREINNGGKNMPEEATGVPEDQTLQPLPTTESFVDETVDKSIEEEIHKDGESAMTDTQEGQTLENEFVDKMNVLEEFDLHEVTSSTSKENEKKVESQSESRQDTTVLKHLSLDGLETIEINPSIETKETENVPVSDTGEKLEIKDGAKIIQEDANVMELEPEKQLAKAQTASINEQEPRSTRPTLVIVEGGTLERIIQEQTHEEEESTPADDNKSNTPKNKHEQESKVLEDIDLPKTMSTFSAENEEHGDQKSEVQCSDVVAKHTDSEEMVTTESIGKSTYDVKILDKTLELPSAENREINDGKKITPQEAIGVPEDQILQSPPTIACVGVDTVDKSIQEEVHKDGESAVTETEEEHTHGNEYEEKMNALEAFDLHEVIASTSEENEEKSEPQLEVSLDTTVLKHPSLERLETTEINSSNNDTEKPENVPASNTGEKVEIKDVSKIIQEKAKEMELATEKSLMETTTESVPEKEALSTMPTPAIPEGEMLEKIIQEQTHEKEESPLQDDDKSYNRKNEHEQATKVLEAIELPATMSKVSAENEEHADQKSEAQITTESIEKSTYDVKLLDKTLELPSPENREINDSRKIMPEKAIGVPQDQTLQPLPTIESVGVETIDRSIQEEIQQDGESAVTSTEEGQTHEKKFEDKMKILEGFGLHEIIAGSGEENEKKAEPQSEASLNSNLLKHHNSEVLETIEINPRNDTEEPKNVLVSDIGEKFETKDGAKIIKVEAKEMELANEKQLPETATESVPQQEAPSTMPTPTIFHGGTVDKTVQEQPCGEDESTPIDDDKSCTLENEVLEAICLPGTISNASAENEEHADPHSEAQSMENMITKHSDSEEMLTTESIKNSSYGVKDREKTQYLTSVENREINDSGKFMPEEAIGMKEAKEMELQKLEEERVLEDKAVSTLPTIAFDRVESVQKSIQEEKLKELNSPLTDSEEGQRPENGFEEKNKAPEEPNLHQATCNTCTENEKKSNPQCEAHRLETMVIKQPNLEGLGTTEIGPSNDTEECEKVPLIQTGRKFESKDGEKIILDEEKEMKDAAHMQIPKSAAGSVPEDEAISTLPTSEFVKGEMVERSFQEQTLKGDESPMIDNDKSCRPENEIEQTSKVLEGNDLSKTMCKVGTENEEHNDHQYEAQSVENMIFSHTNSKGMVKTESSPQAEPSYDMEEQEKIPESHSLKNSEIKDCGKTTPKEPREIKESTAVELQKSEPESVPEDRSLSTFPTIESVKCETAEKITQEEIAVTDTKQGQRPEKEFEDNTEVLEAFGLHKAIGNPCAGNEKKAEPQSQAQSSEIKFVKNPNLEGPKTSEIIQNNDTEELEKVPSTHAGEKLENKDGAKIIQDGIKEMEEVTVMQFLNSAKESVPEDEAQSALPTSEFVKGETVEKSIQEQKLKEAQSTEIDNHMSCRPETELEQTTEVLEPREYITGGNFQDETQREIELQFEDEHHVPGKKLVFINQIEDVDLAEVRKFESGENLAMPNEEFSSCTTIDASKGQQRDESKNTLYRTSSPMPHGVEKEDKDESFNKNDIKNIFERNDARTTESSIVNTSLDTIDNDDRHQEKSKSEKSRETCGNENIEEQAIHSENSLVESNISFPKEGIINQVEDHNVKNFKATDSNEQREIMDLSFENDPARKEAAPRDSGEAIESEAIGKLEIQEAETHQIGSAKDDEGEDEFEKISPSSSDTVMIKGSQDSDVKVSPKKTHGILSGVGSKVKHSISKVKKAITGKSSHSKTSLPK